MVRRFTLGIIAAAILASASSLPRAAFAQAAATPAAPATAASESEINALITQLGDKDFATREAADQNLRKLGWSSMSTFIVARSKPADAETQARLSAIMQSICLDKGGFDQDSAKLLESYRMAASPDDGDTISRQQSLLALRPERAQTVSWALRTADLILRQQLPYFSQVLSQPISTAWLNHATELRHRAAWQQLEWELLAQGYIPDLLLMMQQHPEDAEPFVQALLAFPPTQGQRSSIPPANLVAVAILKATGKPDRALDLAKKLSQREYVGRILAEREDWDALSKMSPGISAIDTFYFVPAAALSFKGQTADSDAMIAERPAKFDSLTPANVQRQIVLMGRSGLINEQCVQLGDNDALVAFLLLERRYAEAFSHRTMPGEPAIGKAAWAGGIMGSSRDGPMSVAPRAMMDAQRDSRLVPELVKLNEWELARAEIKRLDGVPGTLHFLNQADMLMGDSAAIAARLKKIKGNSFDDGSRALDPFGSNPGDAQVWAEAVWEDTKDVSAAFEKLDQIRQGKVPKDELNRLAELGAKPANDRGMLPISADEISLSAAWRFSEIGQMDRAKKFLEDYFASPVGRRSVNLDATRMQYVAAAMLESGNTDLSALFFDKLAARTDLDPDVKFIMGVFQSRNAHPESGRRLLQEADEQIGGDTARRSFLAKTLHDAGEVALARQQAEEIISVDYPVGDSLYAAHKLLAETDQQQGHFALALQNYRLALLAQFNDVIRIPEPYEEFFALARNAAYCESRAALEKSNRVAALGAAINVINLDPEGLDLTLPLVEAFKKAGFVEQSKSLAEINRGLLENILKDFPNSHLHHYLIAKLDIESGFTNDQTQGHLREALELAPENVEYRKLRDEKAK